MDIANELMNRIGSLVTFFYIFENAKQNIKTSFHGSTKNRSI